MVAFVGDKKDSIFKAVSEMYTDVASCPTGQTEGLFRNLPRCGLGLDFLGGPASEFLIGIGRWDGKLRVRRPGPPAGAYSSAGLSWRIRSIPSRASAFSGSSPRAFSYWVRACA